MNHRCAWVMADPLYLRYHDEDAFMQAVGMVNDHVVSCFRHRELR